MPFEHHIKAAYGKAIGYTVMVLSFLIVFVGVKHYRDTASVSAFATSEAIQS